MLKIRRIMAIVGVVLLIGLYITTLIAALLSSEASAGLFQASLFLSFVIPVIIYAYTLLYKLLHPEEKDSDNKKL